MSNKDLRLLETQISSERAEYNSAALQAEVVETKILQKAIELRDLQVEFDSLSGQMISREKQVGKWKSFLMSSGNGEQPGSRWLVRF